VADYQEFQLPKRYHEALVQWQERHFADFYILQKYWTKHFPGDREFHLSAKVAPARDDMIKVGMFKGEPMITRAADMMGNMLYSAVRIVKAQCSTELGSIQQHFETLDRSVSDHSKFSILRIMAEELRHAYQMFWVFSNDDSWGEAGIHNVADQTMEELLSMTTGTHVLDAFNIPFHDPLDNMVFSFLIDRVGKYQLSMQKVFSYAPMARSMPPMLQEESFHLLTGHDLLRDMAALAAVDKGHWSLDEIQKRLNAWFPRAVEMFGNPDGGQANMTFGFKDRLNGESLNAYTVEVARLVRRINLVIVQVRHPDIARDEAERRVDHDEEPGLLRLPHVDFFRLRGVDGVHHHPVDVNGEQISREKYVTYLRKALPAALWETEFFKKYLTDFIAASHLSPSYGEIL
jgi:benzoyl-CoA 2,3-dioxygenase component B